jgi:phenylalanine-4-hydroxylase
VYSSGLQVSGTVTEAIERNGEVVYLKTTGPTDLCYDDRELPGHDTTYHAHGFGSPVGKVKNLAVALEDFSEEELDQVGITIGESVILEFESGVVVSGTVKDKLIRDEHLVLLSLSPCHVIHEGKTLFDPSWGTYDMAVGRRIISAFSGPADPEAFGLTYPAPEELTHKIKHTEEAKRLHAIYQQVREIREQNCSHALIPALWEELKRDHPGDWLCALEILEMLKDKKISDALTTEVTHFLELKRGDSEGMKKLIDDGFAMLD